MAKVKAPYIPAPHKLNLIGKVCTTEEQSKVLLALGLSPDTADMYYVRIMDEDGCYDESHLWVAETTEEKLQCEAYKLPAWSLSALLELLPDIIKEGEYYYTFSLTKSVIEYIGPDGHVLYSAGGRCFIDAAVEMFKKIGI